MRATLRGHRKGVRIMSRTRMPACPERADAYAFDGVGGFRFCCCQAWFEMRASALRAEALGGGRVHE
jgi:hypothetical protein